MTDKIEVFVRPNCPLCDEALDKVKGVVEKLDLDTEIVTKNVEESPGLEQLYGAEVPVVAIDGTAEFRLEVDEEELRRKLS